MYYRTLGKKLCLKEDVVPHKNMIKCVNTQNPSQLSDSAKKRKLEHIEAIMTLGVDSPKRAKRVLFEDEEKTPQKATTSKMYQSSPSGVFYVEAVPINVGCQVKPQMENQTTTTKGLIKTRSVGTSTSIISASVLPVRNTPSSPVSSSPSSSSSFIKSSSSSITLSEQASESDKTSSSIVTKETRKNTSILLIEKQSRFYLGLPQRTYYLVKMLSNWIDSSYVDILITLKKIRLDDVYIRLGNDFGISAVRVGNIFVKTVPKIAGVLQNFVFWPDTHIIKKLLPIPFRYRYSNVISIIDCFEIEIQKPSNPLVQSQTWSEYKKCNTLKYLISCTPNGFVNFVSGGYGGRISDRDIVKESNYLSELPQNISVMADRGFKHIDALLLQHKCTLVRPPSVSEGKKLSKSESREAKRIASLRIHIERIIRRVREFQMLRMQSVVHNSLLYLMNCIVIIVCGLINVQEPLIK